MSRIFIAIAFVAVTFWTALPCEARTVTLGRTETRTDYVSAGIGGIGSGPGTIVVSGVKGGVRKAFLYWHGIDNSSSLGVYDNETITFAGQQVTGTSLGDAETNCWGAGSSRAFFADVTPLVTGNGSYVVSGFNAKAGHSGNGASLIVLFNDADPENDRDLVFFEGNDSNVVQFAFPGETNGWQATLSGIQYDGGSVFAQLHVGDGQFFPDGSISFAGVATVSIPDTTLLWDGLSVPNAGFSRAGTDGLWDIHTFDITEAFGNPGLRNITFSGMEVTNDCHSLVALMLDLGAGAAPCGNGVLDEGEECDPAGANTAECPGVQTCVNDCSCGCTSDAQCNDGTACTLDRCDLDTGACEHEPACATGPGCQDTCDENAAACRLCGRPYDNLHCIVNAVFVLQAALDLRSCELCACDVDSSGSITTTDALRILRTCVGLPTELVCTIPEDTTTTMPVTTTTDLVTTTTDTATSTTMGL
jgi:hypothetical protein